MFFSCYYFPRVSSFLGGIEEIHQESRARHKNGIIGCISHMTLSQEYHIKLIAQATKEVNIRTCI